MKSSRHQVRVSLKAPDPARPLLVVYREFCTWQVTCVAREPSQKSNKIEKSGSRPPFAGFRRGYFWFLFFFFFLQVLVRGRITESGASGLRLWGDWFQESPGEREKKSTKREQRRYGPAVEEFVSGCDGTVIARATKRIRARERLPVGMGGRGTKCFEGGCGSLTGVVKQHGFISHTHMERDIGFEGGFTAFDRASSQMSGETKFSRSDCPPLDWATANLP